MTPAGPGDPPLSAWLVRFTLTFAAFSLLFCLLDGFEYFEVSSYLWSRRDVPNPVYITLVYTGAYFGCALASTVVFLHVWRPVRYAGYAVFVVTVACHLTFRRLNGLGFTYHEALLFWMESSFLLDALRFFVASYALPLALSLAAVVGFERYALPRLPRVRSPLALVLPIAAIGLYDRMLERTFTKVYQTPVTYRIPLLTYYAYKHRVLFYGERDAPYLEPRHRPWADHIVLVMDESVRGDLLGINGSRYDTTPRLAGRTDQFCNYGVASALSNTSSSSNIMLQSGLRPDQLPDSELRALKNPNIFSYMQRSGFSAYLMDAQIYSEKPPNFMTQFDIRDLDGHLLVRPLAAGRAEYEMDLFATELLTAIIEQEPHTFTYILKSGAHFPYTDKAPESERRFQPTLGIGDTRRGTERTLNSYLNALSWAVDAYLVDLIAALEATGERVLVIYTSDHGQSILERVNGELHLGFPHATPVDPPIYQAMVPMMIFGVGDGVREEVLAHCDAALRDRVSGFEIFPTLLVAAGYDPEQIRRHYSYSLLDAEADRSKRIFASGNIFGRGGGYQNGLIRNDTAAYVNLFVLPESVDEARSDEGAPEPAEQP